MQTCLQGMRACRVCSIQAPVRNALARPVQHLQPFAAAVAQPRHLCNSTGVAATEAQATAAPDATAAPVSQARERREFKPRSTIKHILVSSTGVTTTPTLPAGCACGTQFP